MMTRKDYVSTAEILRSVKNSVSPEIHSELVKEFSVMFAKDNSRFDSARFQNACEGEK